MTSQSGTIAPQPADLVARARELAPILRAEQQATIERTHYSDEVHRLFLDAGFYRILQPRRYGGLGLGIDTYFDVVMELARGDLGTAWAFCLGSAHSLTVASYLPESAQEELFSAGHLIAPSVSKPAGSAERLPDGSWRVSGLWRYASGSVYATHFMGHAPVEGEPDNWIFFAIPRSDFDRLDDWGTAFGLQGTGSHSIQVDGAIVPPHLAFEGISDLSFSADLDPVGVELHGSRRYGGTIFTFYILEITALHTGAILGALDEYERLMTSVSPLPPFDAYRHDDADYQRWYAESVGMAFLAQCGVRGLAQEWQRLADTGRLHIADELKLILTADEITKTGWDLLQKNLFRTIGAGEVRDGTRMTTIWRDLSTMHGHYTVIETGGEHPAEALARFRFRDEIPALWSPDYNPLRPSAPRRRGEGE